MHWEIRLLKVSPKVIHFKSIFLVKLCLFKNRQRLRKLPEVEV